VRAGEALNHDAERIAGNILKREELGSTGIGGGIAIPHARIEHLTMPFGVVARLRRPLDFDAVDGQPVDLVFLLLLPIAPASEQLNALAAVTRKLRNPNVLRDVRSAPDGARLYNALVASA
jgi:PTS system nitrogen regulatory IIA component